MSKNQIIGIVIVLILALLAGYWRAKKRDHSIFSTTSFDKELPISSTNINWENKPPEDSISVYQLGISNLILKADNTLDLKIWFNEAPIVMESVLGSQLGRNIFQIPYQSFDQPDTLHFSGIDMSKFNPFEPFTFLFIYEYDTGYRARHTIEFALD